jgi:hypothetical protein
MKHLSEEQVVLHCYGDAEDAEVRRHLAECHACREEFDRVQALLKQIEPTPVPEPPAIFEEKTWLELRDRLPRKAGGFRQWFPSPPKTGAPDTPWVWAWWGGRWALAAAAAILVIAAAFLAGRFWPRPEVQNVENQPTAANAQRVVLVAVGDHLERSQMLLVEVMNTDAEGPVDLSSEQKQARDLLDANHLYRVSAQRTGDPQMERLLDELGRVLTEIANSPSEVLPSDLQQIRARIQSDNLLFKVRVVGSEVNSRVRRQEQSPAGTASQRL